MVALRYDPRDPGVMDNPLPVLQRLQDEDPVHWSADMRGWMVTRYEDVRKVLLQPAMSADRLTPYFANLPGPQQDRIRDLIRYLNTWVAFKDPPDHARMRAAMNAVFTVRDVESLRPKVEVAVEHLLERLAPQAEFDFIREFAFPLPATVIMTLCGLPPGDMDQIKVWSEQMKPFIGSASASPDKNDQAQEGAVNMAAYFREVIRQRRKSPGEDVISRLLAQQHLDSALTDDEVIGTCMLFLFGGHETTTNLIGNGLRAMMRFPDAREQLLADPALIKPAVEEILRYDGPTGGLVRVVKVAHEFQGRAFAEGERVFLMIHAANHDRRKFAAPDTFDITRTPNQHLTFNYGTHFCLGAPLARMEGHIAIARVLARFPKMRLTAPVQYMDTLVMRGVREMHCAQE